LYTLLAAVIVWQGYAVIRILRRPPSISYLDTIAVSVSGNVDRPGTYRVPQGTTQFEILKVAGVRLTSDLSSLSLSSQVDANQDIAVGVLDKPVGLAGHVRLEFYLGDMTIEASDGRQRPVQEGLSIDAGNIIRTRDKAQAEFSINDYSRLDMDNNTEISFDKIGADDGKRVIDVYQRTGMCWYKTVYAGADEVIRVFTPLAHFTIGGKRADFTVEADAMQVSIEVREGLVTAERPATGELLNLVAPQRAAVYADGRPIDITKISPDASLAQRFAELNKKKVDALARSMPVNILLCALPGVFHLVSIQFDRTEVRTVNIPSNVYVGDYVQGFSTIHEAFLYGGSAFVSTIVEKLLNARIPKYAIIEKDDVVRAVSTLGGVTVTIDKQAAAALGKASGKQNLKDDEIIAYVKPGLSGPEDAARRQMEVIEAVFDSFRSKSVVMTAVKADQILSGVESNLTSAEVMTYYAHFSSRPNWSFRRFSLPAKSASMGGKIYQQPQLDACRKILTEG